MQQQLQQLQQPPAQQLPQQQLQQPIMNPWAVMPNPWNPSPFGFGQPPFGTPQYGQYGQPTFGTPLYNPGMNPGHWGMTPAPTVPTQHPTLGDPRTSSAAWDAINAQGYGAFGAVPPPRPRSPQHRSEGSLVLYRGDSRERSPSLARGRRSSRRGRRRSASPQDERRQRGAPPREDKRRQRGPSYRADQPEKPMPPQQAAKIKRDPRYDPKLDLWANLASYKKEDARELKLLKKYGPKYKTRAQRIEEASSSRKEEKEKRVEENTPSNTTPAPQGGAQVQPQPTINITINIHWISAPPAAAAGPTPQLALPATIQHQHSLNALDAPSRDPAVGRVQGPPERLMLREAGETEDRDLDESSETEDPLSGMALMRLGSDHDDKMSSSEEEEEEKAHHHRRSRSRRRSA